MGFETSPQFEAVKCRKHSGQSVEFVGCVTVRNVEAAMRRLKCQPSGMGGRLTF